MGQIRIEHSVSPWSGARSKGYGYGRSKSELSVAHFYSNNFCANTADETLKLGQVKGVFTCGKNSVKTASLHTLD